MPSQTTERSLAIPLRRFESKPGSSVLALFTKDFGQIRVFSRVRGSGKKAKAGFLSPFSTYEVLFAKAKGSSGLYELREHEVRSPRPSLNEGQPLGAWAAASLLSELVLKTTENRDPHPYLFEMLDTAYDCLAEGVSPEDLLSAFLVKYLEHMGYKPRVDLCSCGKPVEPKGDAVFEVSYGGICCESCLAEGNPAAHTSGTQTRFSVDPAMRAALERYRLARFRSLAETPLVSAKTRRLVELLVVYTEYHLEVHLKSLSFLKDMDLTRKEPIG